MAATDTGLSNPVFRKIIKETHSPFDGDDRFSRDPGCACLCNLKGSAALKNHGPKAPGCYLAHQDFSYCGFSQKWKLSERRETCELESPKSRIRRDLHLYDICACCSKDR
jgi:hypothetical protein